MLQVRDGDAARPVKNQNLYLGATIRDNTGTESVVGFERLTAPRAITDDQGHFVFQNVAPGNYGLILDIVFQSFLLSKPDSEAAEIVTVEVGKQVDLGTLLYDSLPLLPRPAGSPYP